MLKKLIVILLLIVFIQGCDSTEPPIVENEPLIPLNIGNYWLYQGYNLDPIDGSEVGADPWKWGFKIFKPSLQTNDTSNNNNFQMSLCAENLEPVDDSYSLPYGGFKLVNNKKNGFYYNGIIRKDTLVMSFNDLIFANNAKKGQVMRGHVFYYSTLGNLSNIPDEVITNYTCVSMDSLFSTPLGNFRCIVYKMIYADYSPLFRNEVYYFIKTGIGIVGMVQMAFFYNDSKYNFMFKTVLTDYKINYEN